jgi:hypothetical protein
MEDVITLELTTGLVEDAVKALAGLYVADCRTDADAVAIYLLHDILKDALAVTDFAD